MTEKVLIEKVKDIQNTKAVFVEFSDHVSIPAPLRGMSLYFRSSSGTMIERMRAAKFLKRTFEK